MVPWWISVLPRIQGTAFTLSGGNRFCSFKTVHLAFSVKIRMPTWKSRSMPGVIGHKPSNHFMMIFIHRRWRHWLPYSSFFQNLYNVFMYNVCTCVSNCTLYSLLTPIPFRAMGVDTLTVLPSWTHIPANRLFNYRQWFKLNFIL